MRFTVMASNILVPDANHNVKCVEVGQKTSNTCVIECNLVLQLCKKHLNIVIRFVRLNVKHKWVSVIHYWSFDGFNLSNIRVYCMSFKYIKSKVKQRVSTAILLLVAVNISASFPQVNKSLHQSLRICPSLSDLLVNLP